VICSIPQSGARLVIPATVLRTKRLACISNSVGEIQSVYLFSVHAPQQVPVTTPERRLIRQRPSKSQRNASLPFHVFRGVGLEYGHPVMQFRRRFLFSLPWKVINTKFEFPSVFSQGCQSVTSTERVYTALDKPQGYQAHYCERVEPRRAVRDMKGFRVVHRPRERRTTQTTLPEYPGRLRRPPRLSTEPAPGFCYNSCAFLGRSRATCAPPQSSPGQR
jgi:hypothetical protein